MRNVQSRMRNKIPGSVSFSNQSSKKNPHERRDRPIGGASHMRVDITDAARLDTYTMLERA